MNDSQRYSMGAARQGGGFRSYAAGAKTYGMVRNAPNLGPVSDLSGYVQRDREAAARRNLTLKRMQYANQLKFQAM